MTAEAMPFPASAVHSKAIADEGPAILPAIVMALVLFLVIRGPASLDPTNILWLDMNDRAMHSLGWWFFREAPWGWPPGASPNYGLELANSVALVDALPLFAFPFKLLGPWLPEYFQYWGWWHLTCFVLQAVFAVLIAHELRLSRVIGLAAALLCVISPAFLARLDVHMALSGHWVLLAAIWLYVRRAPPPLWAWPLLLGTVSAIHGYLLVMVFAIYVAAIAQRLWLKSERPLRLGIEGAAVAALIVAVLWVGGIFMVSSVQSHGFGRWRMNLLGPFNPDFWSLTLPKVRTNINEWEGANYLGIGVFALLAIGLVAGGWRELRRLVGPRFLPLVVMAVGMGVFALSHKIAFGSIELFTIPLPAWLERFLTIFRSSGRMFWPLGYLLIFFALVLMARRFSPNWAMALCVLLAMGQLLDEQRGWRGAYIGPERTGAYWRTPLESPIWAALAPHYDKMRSLPVENTPRGWRPLSWYALQNGMATASIYLGRVDPIILAREQARGDDILDTGAFEPEALYSLDRKSAWRAMAHVGPDDVLTLVDSVYLFAPGAAPHLAAAGISWEPYTPTSLVGMPAGPAVGR